MIEQITNLIIPPAYAEELGPNYAFGGIKSLGEGLTYLVLPMFSIATTAVAFYFIYGAFKFITSGGNKEGIAQGRQMIVHAIIGFLLLIMLFLVVEYLPGALGLIGASPIR